MDCEYILYLLYLIITAVSFSVPSLLRMTAVRKDLNELREALTRTPRELSALEGRGAERPDGATEVDGLILEWLPSGKHTKSYWK